jgi:hypothetical protein
MTAHARFVRSPRSVRLGAALAAIGAAVALVAPAGAAPAADAWTARAQLDTQRCGPYCRAAVPPEVYRYSASADLSDLRVLDGAGKVQPFARYRVPAVAAGPSGESAVPVYPVTAATRGALAPETRLRMERTPAGAVRFEVDAGQGVAGQAAPAAVVAYVVDARSIDTAVAGVRLDATFAAGRLLPLTIERSRDLKTWEPVARGEPVYRLDGASGALAQSTVRFAAPLPLRESFLRITWPADAVFELRALHVLFDAVASPARAAVDLVAVASDGRTVEWELPAAVGWEALELRPAGRNALLPLVVQARRAPSDPWIDVGRGVVYRIAGAPGTGAVDGAGAADSSSPPLRVAGGAYRRLRVVIDDKAPPLESPLKARLLFPAEEIVFLAQGSAPFSLVTGTTAPGSAGAALPVASLLPDYRAGAEGKVPLSVVTGIDVDPARAAPPATFGGLDVRTLALWAVLGVAVLLLSLFAYSLVRKLRAAPAAGESRQQPPPGIH